eukprot:COSAG02_NODE_483_length_21396_cov_20.544801_12_plen_72_part_00
MGTGQSTRKEIPIGTEPRLMKLYGHENQVSTIQGEIASLSHRCCIILDHEYQFRSDPKRDLIRCDSGGCRG